MHVPDIRILPLLGLTAPRLRRIVAVLLLFVGLAAFLPGFATLPVTDRDEARFVQASRQMVESGDPIEIRFGDTPRLKKPAGIYWLQSAAALASGAGAEAPLWVYRLPSLAGAVLALWLTVLVGTPLVGRRAALGGAALLAATLLLGAEARIAKTDAVLLATILAAQAVLARLHMRVPGAVPPGSALAFVFWGALAFGILVKGPIAPGVVGATALAVALLRREAGWLAPLRAPLPIALGAAIVLPWFVAITLRSGAEFWAGSVGTDLLPKMASGQEGKGAPPGSYLALLWATFWPASALLVLALPAIWRARATKPVVFLAAWVLPWWGVLEAVPTKLLHYPLPLYPALALAAAHFAPAGIGSGRGWRGAAIAALVPGPALGGAALALAWQSGARATELWPLALGLAVATGCVAALALVIWHGLWRPLVALSAAAGLALWSGLFATLPALDSLWPGHRAVETAVRLAHAAGCDRPRLTGWGYSEPSLLWLGGRETRLIAVHAPLPADLVGGACQFVIRSSTVDTPIPAACVTKGRFTGFALGAGRSVTLDLLDCGVQ
ncbi:ArnT family glycosyltransferase [Rhodobacter maris]|uniref:4-amino-4-deoxy-L-arabinose transferase-like glycosyltransferase n=1 Tax=Rhodobacter maris TaxID=446682 RepID=A0A285RKH4_9RHOB|nr:phospholipid carrier-dependent glycosyltransferase [Rhodobacter maris]SOB94179.1 4-amino-4-deoxy-L-arabinose transferase-like glycosyltransferase [Rhodobacter maris]